MSGEQPSGGSKRLLWVGLAIVVVLGAGVVAVVLANRSDSGVTNGKAEAISTTSSASTTTSSTDSAASSTPAATVAASTATTAPATTTAATASTAKVPTTKPPTPKPTVPPALAVTSVKANVSTFPCSTPNPHYITLTWSTSLADSVTIGIDNPGTFAADLPPSGSLADVPFAACPGRSVTYYIIAKKSNGDQITRTLTVNAGT